MQGGQAQVTRLGKGDGVIHGFAGADLADQNHVRRLTQGVLQRHFVTFRIQSHFTLGDDAAGMVVDVLDGILDGDDMAGAVLVAIADHRRQRSGLAGAGGADEDHQPALGHGQFLQNGRQAQFLDGGDDGFDFTQHHAGVVALAKGADAETANAGGGDREVALIVAFELFPLRRSHHADHDLQRLRRCQGRLGHRRNLAVDLQARRHARGNKQVRCILVHHEFQ